MTVAEIVETARKLSRQEIEKLLHMAYHSFDAKLREYAEDLNETHKEK